MSIAPSTSGQVLEVRIEAIHVTGRRVVATLVDGLVFGLAYYLIALLFGDIRHVGPSDWSSGLPVAADVAYGLGVVAYYLLLEGYLGRTVGKMAAGIKVVTAGTDEVPGPGRAAIRTALRLVDGLGNYLVAFVTVLASDRRQRLGDMVAGTQVVRARTDEAAGQEPGSRAGVRSPG
jgi:uncharacterized RDD family membrane protein YckC